MSLLEKEKEGLLELCKEMINTRSYTGEEKKLAEFLKVKMLELGYDDAYIDELGNVIGVIRGEKEGIKILYDGHLDTVEAENKADWHSDPFQAEIRDGKLYGRGASDMKCALGAMIYAGSLLDKSKLQGEVYVSGTVHEEIAEGIAFRKVLEDIQPDLVVIGEATELRINRGQRGRGEIVLEVLGKSAHSSNPHKGINAVKKMMKALLKMEEYIIKEDEVLGEGILELVDIISEPYPGASVVPRSCKASFDRRLLPGDTKEAILEEIRNLLSPLKKDDPEFDFKVSLATNDFSTWNGVRIQEDRFAPSWKFSLEEKWLKRVGEAVEAALIKPVFSSYSFCTNGSASAGEKNIRTVGFGPGREVEAHIVDEFISMEDVYKACDGYKNISMYLNSEDM